MNKSRTSPARQLVKLCCAVLEEKKAENLRVLDVSAQSSITDFLILATATSEPHLRALRTGLVGALEGSHTHLVGMEASPESGWMVVDAFDVMVHLFTAEKRTRYSLESLWNDAKEVRIRTRSPGSSSPAAPRGSKARARRYHTGTRSADSATGGR